MLRIPAHWLRSFSASLASQLWLPSRDVPGLPGLCRWASFFLLTLSLLSYGTETRWRLADIAFRSLFNFGLVCCSCYSLRSIRWSPKSSQVDVVRVVSGGITPRC